MAAILAVSIFLLATVNAAGVSSSIWVGNPKSVQTGEEGTLKLTLQNMVGDEDVIFRAEVKTDDGNIVTNTNSIEKDYTVPIGTKDTEVLVEYKIPEDAAIDTEYLVVISFKEITSDIIDGGVTIGIAMDTTLPFLVVPELSVEEAPPEKDKISTSLIVIIAIIVIVIILAIVIVKKKRKSEKR